MQAQHCLEHGLAVLVRLISAHPQLFAGASVLVDCKAVYAPAGKSRPRGGERLPAVQLKACVLSLLTEGQALPLVWLFGAQQEADLSLGKQLLRAVLPALVAAGVQEIVMDAGFLDGEWLHALHIQHRLCLVLRVREDMDFYQDALRRARLRNVLGPAREADWREAPLPKIKGEERPTQRQAWVHFAFLAYTLLFLFDRWSRDHPAPLAATRELLVIREGHYALIGLGQFAEIMLDHHATWQAKRQQVLTRLGRPPPPT